jgi:hypothetical protein
LPVTPELAVTTLVGFSPLLAGLVDPVAPAPFDLVIDGQSQLALVTGIRATSAGELVVAASSGAGAKFVAEADSARGITLLRPKEAPVDVTTAVAGDYLVMGSSVDAVRSAAAHVATAPISEARRGEIAEVAVSHAELAGPIRALVSKIGEEARKRLESSDLEDRARHGGRAPDYADPEPIIAALGLFTDESASVVSSTSRVRATARVEPAPSVRVELTPEETGPARDLMTALPLGDLSLLTRLPSWAELTFMWHRGASGPTVADRVAAVFGHRLGPADKGRIEAWAEDLDRGLGRTAVVGSFGDGHYAGGFVLASGGDGSALGRATSGLVDILGIAALRAPIETFAGRINAKVRAGSLATLPVTRVSIALAVGGAKTPFEYRAIAAANDAHGAIVFGGGDVDARLLDLLEERGRTSLGDDATLTAVAQRVHATAACAATVRLRAGARGEQEIAVVTAGTGDGAMWLDVDGSLLAFRALASFAGAPAEP